MKIHTDTQRDPHGDRDAQDNRHNIAYPLWLYMLLGGLAGYAMGQAFEYFDLPESIIFVMIFATLGIFVTLGSHQHRLALPVSIVFASVLIGSALWWEYLGYFGYGIHLKDYFLLSAIIAVAIGTAFIQSWRAQHPRYEYNDLFANAWNNVFIVKFALLLMGAFLLVLLLGTQLFKQVGIDWFFDVLWRQPVTPILMGMMVGVGIAISRQYHQVIFKIRQLAFALLKILAVFAAVIVVGFSLSLPFTFDALFTENSTSQILLALVAISILLLNTLVDKGSQTLPKWQNILFTAQIVLLPVLSSLSIYAISQRIEQYGLMPLRVVALLIAGLLLLHSLVYLWQWVRKGSQWSDGFIEWNPILAGTTLGVIILVLISVIDPVSLSINHQLSRLKSGTVSVEQFDFHTLKSNMGKPGAKAIEDIQGWDNHAQIADIRKAIEQAQPKRSKKLNVEIVADANLPADIDGIKQYRKWHCEHKRRCLIKMLPIGKGGEFYPVRFEFNPSGYVDVLVFTKGKSGQWEKEQEFAGQKLLSEHHETFIEKIRSGQVDILAPKINDIQVGNIQFRERRQ